ncbi:sensor histidine kinase [Cupriavidus necator]|uniref:sensor histidine kinase n=1 Tax=Cupriavidus necator TaxID=106590 RepID=UPI002E77659D|nr:sensor histidine kinase [Cupriavidus necator]
MARKPFPAAPTVEASRRADGAVVISMSDDGPGVPDEEEHKVLERFYRGDASRSTLEIALEEESTKLLIVSRPSTHSGRRAHS